MENKQLFRLCHVCASLNEGSEEVLRCLKCGKSFLPIHYFERIRINSGAAAAEEEHEESSRQIPVNPLNGLIVFW